jgi:hypothetical protein
VMAAAIILKIAPAVRRIAAFAEAMNIAAIIIAITAKTAQPVRMTAAIVLVPVLTGLTRTHL